MNTKSKTFRPQIPGVMEGSIRAFLVENRIMIDQIRHFSIHPAEPEESRGLTQITAHLIYSEAARSTHERIADVSHTDDCDTTSFDRGVTNVVQGCVRDGLVRQVHASCYVPRDLLGGWIYFVIAGVSAS